MTMIREDIPLHTTLRDVCEAVSPAYIDLEPAEIIRKSKFGDIYCAELVNAAKSQLQRQNAAAIKRSEKAAMREKLLQEAEGESLGQRIQHVAYDEDIAERGFGRSSLYKHAKGEESKN